MSDYKRNIRLELTPCQAAYLASLIEAEDAADEDSRHVPAEDSVERECLVRLINLEIGEAVNLNAEDEE